MRGLTLSLTVTPTLTLTLAPNQALYLNGASVPGVRAEWQTEKRPIRSFAQRLKGKLTGTRTRTRTLNLTLTRTRTRTRTRT